MLFDIVQYNIHVPILTVEREGGGATLGQRYRTLQLAANIPLSIGSEIEAPEILLKIFQDVIFHTIDFLISNPTLETDPCFQVTVL